MKLQSKFAACAVQFVQVLALCAAASCFAQTSLGTVPKPKRILPAALLGQTDAVSVAFMQGKLPVAPDAVATLGPDLFGDRINLFNGSFNFEQTDLELPGNSALSVALVRQHTPGRKAVIRGAMGDWDLNTPRIEGTFATTEGWVPFGGNPSNRCSAFEAPPAVTRGTSPPTDFQPFEYGQGVNLVLPGQGGQEILVRTAGNSLAPTGNGSYPLVTRSNWQIGCLPTLLNGTGQGFFALSPEGVRYTFNWMASRVHSSLVKGNALLGRSDFYLMASLVTDRFGNWVRYTYDVTNPKNLLRIESNDGRVITLTYSGGRVASVFDGTRTWQYSYSSQGSLQTIQLPDSSQWQFNLSGLIFQNTQILGETLDCDSLADGPSGTFEGTMTHPSGATGTFTTMFLPHGRTNVLRACTLDPGNPNWTTGSMFPRSTSNQALIAKQITGPGMTAMNWVYGGDSNSPFGEWTCAISALCPDRKSVFVTEPSGAVTRYTYGIRWRANEGQLLRVDQGWNGSVALKATTYNYRESTGQAYPDRFGDSVYFSSDWLSTRNRPQDLRVTTQQGVDFTWQADPSIAGFDGQARPSKTRAFSGLGYTRTDLTQYSDNLSLWVLGQVASVTELTTGSVVQSNTYAAATALRTSSSAFGLLRNSFAYNPDGTLATLYDAANRPTSFQNFMRGMPQRAVFADQTVATRVVNNLGNVVSYTNEVGTTTSYTHDAMGRVASITYPGGDAAAYYPTLQAFVPVAAAEGGLAGGHWRQTISTGNASIVRYFDALWRKRVELRYDTANPSVTTRFEEVRYDASGRKIFESYPERNFTTVDAVRAGRYTSYDLIDRVVAQSADSENGLLTTLIAYPQGLFQRVVTNPRGNATTFSYQAFDAPSEDHIAQVAAPLGVNLVIGRDVFGKANAMTRSGAGASATRNFVYDPNQRLCKTVEPEIGATVQAYDAAGNVNWRASGLALPSLGGCDQASVASNSKVSFTYDPRDRLWTTTYGDGSAGISRTYTADGLLLSNTSGNFTWSLAYNNRRLLAAESLGTPQGAYAFGYGFDSHGNKASMVYPGGPTLLYSPDALGRPAQVSGYVSGIGYHPNGQVSGYTSANGVIHSVSQNLRGLPATWRYAGVVQDAYTFDANGNVASITDQQEGISTRSMGYDALDRLTTANGVWGVGQFSYDALDNLRTSVVGSRSLTHNYNAATNQLTGVSGSINASVAYNANGNLVSRAGQGFTFDIGNRLTSAVNVASYAYDGLGRRSWAQMANGRTVLRVYSQDGRLLFTNDSLKGATRHIHLGDKVVAETNTLSGTRWLHSDALGSPVASTGPAGQLLDRTRYEPYGLTAAGTNPDGIGFTGHVNDVDTGLVYMQQRYYDPVAGRFLSVDPVTADSDTGDSFNRYTYALNNPYKYTDPDGRDPWYKEPPPPPPPPPPASAQTITIVGQRLPAPTAPAPSINVAPALTLIRQATPWALLLTPSPLGAAACEMPGAGPCGMLSEGDDSAQAGKKKEPKSEAPDPVGGHRTNQRPSTKEKHQKADERRPRDQGGEKKDERMRY